MTDRRGGGDRGVEPQAPGYRGALPPRNDSLAKPWVIIVFVVFVLVFALSFANIPSSLFPTPSETPLPSASASVAPSGSGTASGSPEASATGSGSESASSAASASPSGSPSLAASPSPAP